MSAVHSIRLGAPWTTAPRGEGHAHSRKFGRPRRLDPGERVWLVLSGTEPIESIRLNGVFLGRPATTDSAVAADITEFLVQRNELVIETASPEFPIEVSLQIRAGSADSQPA